VIGDEIWEPANTADGHCCWWLLVVAVVATVPHQRQQQQASYIVLLSCSCLDVGVLRSWECCGVGSVAALGVLWHWECCGVAVVVLSVIQA